MKRLIIGAVAAIVATIAVVEAPREVPPDARRTPVDPSLYYVPRSVGAWSGAGDMQIAPIAWWKLTNTEPTWQTLDRMFSYGITAVGKFIRAHPTDHEQNNENIRKAFRTPGIDIIVFRPELWGSTEERCGEGNAPLRWENYPVSLYADLYQHYSYQSKSIFVMSLEADLQLYGLGCKEPDVCLSYGWWDGDCQEACSEWMQNDHNASYGCQMWGNCQYECAVYCCDDLRISRGKYLLRLFNERQAAAEQARLDHPGANLKVFHAIEVNYYGNQDWQSMTVLADVIPMMDHKPDFVGLSLWPAAGDPLEALQYAMDMTGLPPERIFLSQVGAKEGTQPDGIVLHLPRQRDRLMAVIPPLFEAGVAFALVWSMEQPEPTGRTGHSVIDPVTDKRLSGWDAIKEINAIWR